jgi:hypothetical protein
MSDGVSSKLAYKEACSFLERLLEHLTAATSIPILSCTCDHLCRLVATFAVSPQERKQDSPPFVAELILSSTLGRLVYMLT